MTGDSMIKSILVNSLMVIASIAISLIALEFCVRLALPHYDPSGQLAFVETADQVPLLKGPGSVQRQTKNTGDFDVEVRVNALGLREDKNITEAKPQDYFVIGDSYALGWGVEAEARFSNVLEKHLADRAVFNISVPTDFDGYGRLLAYAKRNGANIRNVIVSVCMENDLRLYDSQPASSNPTQVVQSSGSLQRLKNFLTQNSAAYFFVTSVIHANPILRDLAVHLGFIIPNLEAPHLYDVHPDYVASSARRLTNLVTGYPQAIVLIVPSRALWVGTAEQRALARQIHNDFVTAVHTAGLGVVDPRDLMERSGEPLAFHFKHDGHWNARGHALAAELLAEEIQSNHAR